VCTLPAICATHSQHLPRPRDLDSNFPEKMGRGLAWMPDYENLQATTANTRLAAGIRTVLMLLALELGVFWHDIRSLLATIACKQNNAIAHGPIHTHTDTNAGS
jgi:hypothetical protein